MSTTTDLNPTIGALSQCRQSVLVRADELLNSAAFTQRSEQQADALPAVAALLMSSLEELRVAEEELYEQHTMLGERSTEAEGQLRHYQLLFQHAPFPVMVTDLFGNILEANIAASGLFKREGRHLVRKPLAALLVPLRRDEFRARLTRFALVDNARDWRLEFQRVDDVHVPVLATVQVVPGLGETQSGVLLWYFRPMSNADEARAPS